MHFNTIFTLKDQRKYVLQTFIQDAFLHFAPWEYELYPAECPQVPQEIRNVLMLSQGNCWQKLQERLDL